MCLGVQSRVQRNFPMSLLAALPVLLLSFAVSTEAVAQAFAPCSAVAVGLATAAVDISDIDFQNFCSALAVAVPGAGAATFDFSATTDGPVSIDGGVGVSVSGNGSATATAVAIVNGETVVSASASSEGKVAGAKTRMTMCLVKAMLLRPHPLASR